MVSETIMVVLQYSCTFALSVIFSMIAIERKTILANLIASLFWLVLALTNFIIGYTLIGSVISWMFGLICFLFMGIFIKAIVDSYDDYKGQRWELGGF